MSTREAQCACGAMQVMARGEPVRMGMCHCTHCQRRTGSVFGIQAWFLQAQVTVTRGVSKMYLRTAESGRKINYHFCPDCGTTVWWTSEQRPGWIGMAAGTFADKTLPPPRFSSYERHRHAWTLDPDGLPLEHHE